MGLLSCGRRCAVALLAGAALVLGLPAGANAEQGRAYAGDFPDPFVLRAGSSLYYAYATNTAAVKANVQVMSTRDLRTWSTVSDALPRLPVWAKPGRTWAPSVLRRGPRYVLYYTAHHAASGRQCISVAVSRSGARGPFVDTSTAPLICQLQNGGSIDPEPFVDEDGAVYLHWKSDDNALGGAAKLWGSRLTPDGLRLTGRPPVPLFAHERGTWEHPLIEGPQMIRVGRSYHVFYGGNWWESPTAAVGHGRCATPLSGCTKTATTPWLTSNPARVGPAGANAFLDADGRPYVAFHAWEPAKVGYRNGGRRALWIEPLSFAGGRPSLRP
jgi:hypothetical protein